MADPAGATHYLSIASNPAVIPANMPDDGSSVFAGDLVIDEAAATNWEGGAATFINGLAADLSDLRVTSDDTLVEIAWGVKQFSQVGGSRKLIVGLGLPALDGAAATTYRLYRGCTGGPFEDKAGVCPVADGYLQYLALEEAAGNFDDWTTNGYDGVRNGPTVAAGLIGQGQQLDANNEHVLLTSAYGLKTAATWTLWIKPAVLNGNDYGTRGYRQGHMCRENGIRWLENNAFRDAAWPTTLNTWTYIGYRYDGTNYTAWRRNAVDGYDSVLHAKGTNCYAPSSIGENSADTLVGIADEHVFESVCRTENWVMTRYACQGDNGGFWTVGAEEQLREVVPPLHLGEIARQGIYLHGLERNTIGLRALQRSGIHGKC